MFWRAESGNVYIYGVRKGAAATGKEVDDCTSIGCVK